MLNTENQINIQKSRILISGLIALCLGLIIIARLWFLQVVEASELAKAATNNRIKIIKTNAPRGTILDRNENPIAQSKKYFLVSVIPEKLSSTPDGKENFCHIMGLTIEEYDSIIKHSRARKGSPIRIAVDVPLETLVKLGESRMFIDGVTIENDYVRYYPLGKDMAHITGYLREITSEQLQKSRETDGIYKMGDYVGVSGLEKYYENELKGIDGGQKIEVNAGGKVVRVLATEEGVPGKTVKLSIDKNVQNAALTALNGKTGAVVALNPQTGEIYSLISNPSYDPNLFVRGLKLSDWKAIAENKAHPLLNRATNSLYPPGSIFKPIIAAATLENQVANTRTTLYCRGYYTLGNYRKKCWATHGHTDFYKAISQSCDVWFYDISLKLGIENIAKTAREFGIGKATGIDLPEENSKDGNFGIIPDPAWLKKRTGTSWRKGDTLNVSIGQGDVLVSPLQMAMACGAIANKGTLYKPYLLSEIQDVKTGKIISKTKPTVLSKISVEDKYFDEIITAMEQTVSSGTGKTCKIDGIRVGGKTGSAQASGGVAHGWFIAFAPVENPTIAVCAIIERGESGAGSAAPICKAVIETFLKGKTETLNDI